MRRRYGVSLLILIAAALILAFGGFNYFQHRFQAAGPLRAEKILIVQRGAGVEEIAQSLSAEGVIAEPWLFQFGVRYLKLGRLLKAGEYAFPARVSMRGVVRILTAGETVVRKLTVSEGLTSREILEALTGVEGLAPSEVAALPPEGSLLPETYHFSRGDSQADILERMTQDMAALLAEAWAARAEGLPLKSPEEAVILASIVEKETGIAAERPLIAGVFVNRLKKRMRLQSDPTVVYGITLGQAPLGRGLRRKDLQTPSAYNTYQIDGLPPGPIANPGRAAIEAVLNPSATDYLYFVADGSGGHAFAKTLDAHNRNVAKWRKIKKQKAAAE